MLFNIFYLKLYLKLFGKLDQPANALPIADTVLKSVEEYESSRGILEIMSQISACHYKVGNLKKVQELTEKGLKQFPVKLTPEELRKSLMGQGISSLNGMSVEEICRRFSANPAIGQSGKVHVSQCFS